MDKLLDDCWRSALDRSRSMLPPEAGTELNLIGSKFKALEPIQESSWT